MRKPVFCSTDVLAMRTVPRRCSFAHSSRFCSRIAPREVPVRYLDHSSKAVNGQNGVES